MFVGRDYELYIDEIPPGKRARGFADVGLGVVADPHGKELHDLAREILVRRALYVHGGVEKGQHGRILRYADHQIAEAPGALLLEQFHLLEHLAVVAHFLLAGGEVAMPEQSHFFLQRTLRDKHSIRPPVGQTMSFQATRPQPVEKPVCHRLQAPVARRLDLDTQRFAGFFGQIGRGRP